MYRVGDEGFDLEVDAKRNWSLGGGGGGEVDILRVLSQVFARGAHEDTLGIGDGRSRCSKGERRGEVVRGIWSCHRAKLLEAKLSEVGVIGPRELIGLEGLCDNELVPGESGLGLKRDASRGAGRRDGGRARGEDSDLRLTSSAQPERQMPGDAKGSLGSSYSEIERCLDKRRIELLLARIRDGDGGVKMDLSLLSDERLRRILAGERSGRM